MEIMTAAQVKEMLIQAAEDIIDSKDLLTEVDSAIGDGDHGIGMELGMRKAKAKLESMKDTDNIYDLFTGMGKAMMMSMGGASGVIFGSMFQAGGKEMTSSHTMDACGFATLFSKSLASIQERGKAKVGDKTMVDALSPAVEAMNALKEDGFDKMLEAAEQAAVRGTEYTKEIEAKFGRAKTQSSTIGFADAGAVSVSIIFKSMHNYIKKQGRF